MNVTLSKATKILLATAGLFVLGIAGTAAAQYSPPPAGYGEYGAPVIHHAQEHWGRAPVVGYGGGNYGAPAYGPSPVPAYGAAPAPVVVRPPVAAPSGYGAPPTYGGYGPATVPFHFDPWHHARDQWREGRGRGFFGPRWR